MPGTQPGEVGNIESVDKCDNCHQDNDPVVNIAHDWRGSMMAHAGRDPIFWATVAIAEQDFDGAGDLCIRCHTMGGWQAGNSTPTDASTLTNGQAADGVGCDVCHKMTNPDNSEHTRRTESAVRRQRRRRAGRGLLRQRAALPAGFEYQARSV